MESITVEPSVPVTSTAGPSCSTVVDSSPRVVVEKLPSYSAQPFLTLKSFTDGCAAQSQASDDIRVSFKDIPEDLRKEMEAFYVESNPNATKALLNSVQVAYIRWFIANQKPKKGATAKEFALELYRKGVADKIWPLNFRSKGVPDFAKYLTQRLKNERARPLNAELKRMAENQKERLSKKMCRN